MQCLEVSGALRLIYRSLGVKGLIDRLIAHHPEPKFARGSRITFHWLFALVCRIGFLGAKSAGAQYYYFTG